MNPNGGEDGEVGEDELSEETSEKTLEETENSKSE
jgi:hypothetical protein